MSDYNYSDLELVFEYAKNNPDKTIEDWIEIKSKTLTEEEKEEYKGIQYFKIPFDVEGKEEYLYLFKHHTSYSLQRLVTKFIGNKSYYQFCVGDNYGYMYSLISLSENLFTLNNWKKHDDYKWVEIIESKIEDIFMLYNGDATDNYDEYKFDLFAHYKNYLQRNYYYFWDSGIVVYINKNIDLDFKPYEELFVN